MLASNCQLSCSPIPTSAAHEKSVPAPRRFLTETAEVESTVGPEYMAEDAMRIAQVVDQVEYPQSDGNAEARIAELEAELERLRGKQSPWG
jgi:hypothetical protein